MKGAAVFAVLGALLIAWLVLDLLLVGISYAARSAALFGKRPSGERAAWSILLMLPYTTAAWLSWRLHIARAGESVCHEVRPGLWVGRRARAEELPPGVALVVDVTEAFGKPRDYDNAVDYRTLPCLNCSIPPREATKRLLEELKGFQGGLYIHCTIGHGRSAMLAAMLLVARGDAATFEDAVKAIEDAGRVVRLTDEQRAFARRLIEEMRSENAERATGTSTAGTSTDR